MKISDLSGKIKDKILYHLRLEERLKDWDDERYLKLIFWLRVGEFLNLKNPQTYNQKLQWLKLNYRVQDEWKLVDKFEAKAIVSSQIGAERVVPTLALYHDPADICFDELPQSFVLKCTHNSGGVVLVKDKNVLNEDAAREKLAHALRRNYFFNGREHHYRDIKPRIIAEPFLEDAAKGQLLDYKFFCFNGEVRAMFVASDRSTGNVKFDYFDANFHPLDLRQLYPKSQVPPERPQLYEEMLDIARTLSQSHPHVRVDLYEANGQIYFGEMTFYHFGGMHRFRPAKWDRIFGEWLTLPEPLLEA